MAGLYIGLISGTSLDGVDAVLVDFDTAPRPRVLAHRSCTFADDLKHEFLALNSPGTNELHRAALAANALARAYARLAGELLRQAAVPSTSVRAIGAHGQTVRHRPQEFDGTGYTLQLNNPALLSELCAMNVVADFRSRDVAAGGQGAPLVPPFHQALFASPTEERAVLNIGGISNLTVLASADRPVIGFDCGPGNALMDAWCLAHTGQAYDDAGRWAAQGRIHAGLLALMLQDPYFAKPPPKSTGRDLFNPAWLQAQLSAFPGLQPQDVQATLTELTAQSCAGSLAGTAPRCKTLIVCGGGARNAYLMGRLQSALPRCQVQPSDDFGLPALQVEATAFAWLARQTILGQTSSLPSVTGARGERILGAIYPA